MAAASDSSKSWSDVVHELISSFLLLRDIFGYALPGAVFLGIGVLSGRLRLKDLHELLSAYQPPTWVVIAASIAACYVVGHVLASIAYLRIDIYKVILKLLKSESLKDYPTEVNADDLYYRHYYADLFQDKERRETLSLFTFATMTGLLLGFVVFCWLELSFKAAIGLAGLFLFADSLTTMGHLKRVRTAIHEAGNRIMENDRKTAPPAGQDQQDANAGHPDAGHAGHKSKAH